MLYSSYFAENVANSLGGAIYSKSGVTIKNSTFKSNEAVTANKITITGWDYTILNIIFFK
ncbi:hypothetical protein [Methanobrevibacter sp.]|uniref:hypothetical protein n=1 Tax=Methanobrevibacter sp. TaxID=66852 RepID=UPI0038908217